VRGYLADENAISVVLRTPDADRPPHRDDRDQKRRLPAPLGASTDPHYAMPPPHRVLARTKSAYPRYFPAAWSASIASSNCTSDVL
jgi:hypothetical protein